MGRQGGIARFTGSLREMTFYFDDGKELVRWKSRMNRKKWLARREMWRQHNSARLFGAASVVASNLWVGMPAGVRRLADGCGYGRLVGRCNSLMGEDGQLWDADLLKGLELNENALAPSVHFRVSGNGLGDGIRLEGMAQLHRELDLALGDSAGTMPASFLVAHGLGPYGLGMKGLKLTAEEARAKVAFKNENIEIRNEDSPAKTHRRGNRPVKPRVQRRFRVWVNAAKVAETLWNPIRKKFRLDTFHGVGGVGYVTDWQSDFEQNSLNLRNPFEGKTMEFDGAYVVYCALEVSEKRGRHWVRLPYCCRFRVVDVVGIENGELIVENVGIGGLESNECLVESGELRVESEALHARELGSVLVDGVWHKERSLHFGREVLIEFKRPFWACLDIGSVQNFERLWLQSFESRGDFVKGIRAGP